MQCFSAYVVNKHQFSVHLQRGTVSHLLCKNSLSVNKFVWRLNSNQIKSNLFFSVAGNNNTQYKRINFKIWHFATELLSVWSMWATFLAVVAFGQFWRGLRMSRLTCLLTYTKPTLTPAVFSYRHRPRYMLLLASSLIIPASFCVGRCFWLLLYRFSTQ